MHRWENFKNLTEDELERISENRYEANFKPGEVIFKEGAPTSDAVFLISGMAKMYLEGYDGKRILLGIAKPGELIAGPGTYVDSRHHYSVSALTDTKACFINMNVLKDLVHQNSQFAEGWLVDISKKSLRTFYKMLSISQKKMHGRLAEGLLYLSNSVFKSDDFEFFLSRQDLGDLTGMAKENVVRILREFAEEKIIDMTCPKLKILNKEKLQRISETG